jgi:signal transduction histidine kinase
MVPTFGLEEEFPLSERGGIQLSPDHPLYQIPNPNNEIVDIFVSSFDLYLGSDSTERIKLLLELVPTSREVRGLYPSLSMEQSVYDDVKLINSFDHAIYRSGILYTKRGRSVFPVHMPDYKDFQGKTNRIRGAYHEYLEPIDAERLVVVRYSQQSPLEVVTSFSFIFYFFSIGSLVLIGVPAVIMRSMRTHPLGKPIPLRGKIRLGLITISVLPMLVIMALLYPFVSNRYHEEARETLSEETLRILSQIEPSFNAYLSDPLHRISELKEFREMIRSLEGVLSNDINIFDRNGVRLATTQPLITELGIRTDLMNEVALDSVRDAGISDLVIQEKIGNLEYLSGYRPILGKGGIPVGYVNVPYLGRQDQLQEQVINFLSYLANIYLLVFLLINIVAVGISGTITKPLTLVQQRLSATTLGHANQRIEYQSRDEIGAIVQAYNQMITQLEQSEQKLAQSERETAWRQMARQVAHEIKNPLTPMRLNIQHLMRAWKEQSPRLEKMFPKVMNSLMVQIDSLVRIANSFHEFAKMPEPVKGHLRLNEVLLEVVDLYTQSEEAIWLIDIPQEPFWTHADRDQLSRCFNNIIKNALQSLEENGIVHVSMRAFDDKARIEIKDNGKGMSAEVQKRIFEPSFSTKTSGMGLGLAIVKRIIEHASGSISFRSEEGVGTTFFIELPRVEAPVSRSASQLPG